MKYRAGYVFLAAFLLLQPAFSLAQTPMGPPQDGGGMRGGRGMMGNPVARLNKALEAAGAAEVDQTQQQQLTTLVDNYRAARQNAAADTTFQDARKNLEAAILARDETAINSAADAISAQ